MVIFNQKGNKVISLTVKEIAHLLNRREKYVYLLLQRRKISLKQIDYERIIDLVFEYRLHRGSPIIPCQKLYNVVSRESAAQFIDKALFGKLYEHCRTINGGKCSICGGKGQNVHHVDLKHGNMRLENMELLCTRCHGKVHFLIRQMEGRVAQYIMNSRKRRTEK